MSIDANYTKVLKNSRFEVLTNRGFKDFRGLGISNNTKLIKLITNKGYSIICTTLHSFYDENSNPKYANNFKIGDSILVSENKIDRVKDIKYFSKLLKVYDLLSVSDGSNYLTNNIQSKNCLFMDEFAFVRPNIADEFWASNYPTLSCITEDTRILTDKGIFDLRDFIKNKNQEKGIENIDISVYGKEGIENSTNLYISPKSLTKVIELQRGLSLECTENHPLFGVNNTGFFKKKSSDITEGDFLEVRYDTNIYGNFQPDFHYEKTHNNGRKSNLHVTQWTKDLAYIIGGWIAEGWNNKQNSVLISNTDPEFRDVFLKEGFSICKSQPQKLISNIAYKNLFEYFLGEQFNKKCWEKRVPKTILRSSKEIQSSFISGYLDGDGSISKSGTIIFGSSSKELLIDIQLILLNMGIISDLIRCNRNEKFYKNHILPQGTHMKEWHDSYQLKISRNYGRRFLEEFDLRISRKKDRLIREDLLIKQEKIPMFSWIKTEIIEILNKNKLSIGKLRKEYGLRFDKAFSKGNLRYISKEKLINFIKLFPSQISENLKRISNEKILYLPVQRIRESQNKTYSLVCPKTESYLQNGVLGGNTGGSIIVVSTANGIANLYYNLWQKAQLGENNFASLRVDWWEVPGRDEAWRESTIGDIGIVRFNQEFGNNFLGSQHTLVDANKLRKMSFTDPIAGDNAYSVYESRKENAIYLFGVDVAAGTRRDSSVIQIARVINKNHLKQVACWRRNDVDVFDFGDILYSLANKWNEAYVNIENNGGLGSALINKMWNQLEYTNLYMDRPSNSVAKKKTKKTIIGTNSHTTSKKVMTTLLKRYVEEDLVDVCDRFTISELTSFIDYGDERFKAAEGANDDTVIALGWLLYMFHSTWFQDILEWEGYLSTEDQKAVEEINKRIMGNDYQENKNEMPDPGGYLGTLPDSGLFQGEEFQEFMG